MMLLLLALAGGAGAASRFVLDAIVRARIRSALPVGTMLINVSGSLLLGFLTGLVSAHAVTHELQLVLGTGFLGGYTTFSTASFETVRLIQSGRIGLAVVNGAGTLLLTVGAATAGTALGLLL